MKAARKGNVSAHSVADLEGLVQISHGTTEPEQPGTARNRGGNLPARQGCADSAAAQALGPAGAGPGGAHTGTAPAANRCTQHLAQRAGETRR